MDNKIVLITSASPIGTEIVDRIAIKHQTTIVNTINTEPFEPEPFIITSRYMDFSYESPKSKRGSKFTPKKKKRKKKC